MAVAIPHYLDSMRFFVLFGTFCVRNHMGYLLFHINWTGWCFLCFLANNLIKNSHGALLIPQDLDCLRHSRLFCKFRDLGGTWLIRYFTSLELVEAFMCNLANSMIQNSYGTFDIPHYMDCLKLFSDFFLQIIWLRIQMLHALF